MWWYAPTAIIVFQLVWGYTEVKGARCYAPIFSSYDMMTSNPKGDVSPGKKTVLIVEDDQFLLRLYRVQIEKLGIDTWTATDGEKALLFLAKEPPHAIILDLMLPGISGFDVLSSVRENKQWKDVPVFIVSNLGQKQDIERAKAMGVKEYTVKADMKLADIIARVAKYLA